VIFKNKQEAILEKPEIIILIGIQNQLLKFHNTKCLNQQKAKKGKEID